LSADSTKTGGEEPTRRDFLYLATGAAGVVGAAGLAWPFVSSMAPNAAVRAAGAPVDVNVAAIEPGQSITVIWRGAPYFVRRLTEEERVAAADLGAGDMKAYEPVEDRLGGPEEASEWTVVSASCTHLGCIPSQVENGAEGWSCPCHGSVFDVAGRILRGPAATNLPLPPYVFASAENLIIGTEDA
jgi:ubiquinol-cytochrome c reductase iron-sulfur subunit